MIRVDLQPEPLHFDSEIRQRGAVHLRNRPTNSSSKFWKNHEYWRNIQQDLYDSYHGICAYVAEWFSYNESSCDHFLPRCQHPDLAYEWANYRLASQKANAHKAHHVDIIDPFEVLPTWFTLDITSGQVKPGVGKTDPNHQKIKRTIDILKLNSDKSYMKSRLNIIDTYIDDGMTYPQMCERYPFIASELERQDLVDRDELRKRVRGMPNT